ncbi:M14 family zinc carboxypeptidase, partial [uncultured Algibacter sp.]|uniref:M14 family zinc carboxypeptidase n=1 Tax=uncultured Algibacter sp. TaxID=298659 RepID=UPI0026272E48
MKKITLLSLMLILIAQLSYSQSLISKRIKINNPTKEQLLKVREVGIDLSCGAVFDNNNLILELGGIELNALDNQGISYSILVEDLIDHYKKKNDIELPIAKAELAAKKAQKVASKSLSTKSESIDNFIQYEGCSEVNWAVPTNFNLGSMGGCLTYSEVLAELDQMRALYPNLISVKTDASPGTVTNGNSFTDGPGSTVYDTWAGQPIYYVRISDNPDTDEANEPESLYSGMTHSREVSSMMNLIYYMWYVLENYGSDAGIKNLVDNHEMYFIPVANPDGLMWNEQIAPSGGGLQRKNLGDYNTGDNALRGVDLNRNYDYFWGSHTIYANGTVGSSGSTNSNVYRGPSAFSEPETQIVRDFSATREFKTAMNHHASSNLIPHSYNGYPGSTGSGRESEYHKFCHDMTRFNRYIYGEAPDILTIANGDMSDWMLGGAADLNGSTGSGQGILALAPENGSWITADGEGGFWPNATKIVEIAQRAVRMNFVNAYHSGKFAQFHDLNPSDINTTSGNLEFGLEYLGQTLGDITLNVTAVSGIQSITPPTTQTGWSKLEQRTVTAAYTLDAGIQPNDEIEFQVTLSNDDGYVMYQANIIKLYNPSVLFIDNPDIDNLTNWTASGGSWGTITTTDYNGNSTTAITDSPSGAYGNNQSKTLTLNSSIDISSSSASIVQFFAKWDLERNFDYVQIEGSTNGTTWIPLCGKYSKPGSSRSTNRYSSTYSSNTSTGKSTSDQNNQPTGESIYDADTMDKWVMEEILIDGTENNFLFGASNARFRFVFDSDNTNRADGYPTTFDGFIFDDFKVISIDIPCVVSVPTNLTVSSINTTSATATWDNIPSATYDLRYKQTSSGTWINVTDLTSSSYNLTGLSAPTDYEVQVRSNCDASSSSYSSSTNFTTLNTVTLHEGYFETGLDNWTLGGNDAFRYSESANATSFSYENDYSLIIRDNSGTTSSITSETFDLTTYSNTEISFYYYPNSMEAGEDFFLQFFNGSTWQTIKTYTSGTDFNNGSFYSDNISLDNVTYNFTASAQFRFQCDASANNDQIYIDQVIITGTVSCSKPADDVTNATICSGETYVWAANGASYTTNQSALTITNDGCTADDVLNLTVTPKPADDVTNATICSGETYVWAANGASYTTNQTGLTITNDGCTADDVLNLTVTPKPADDVTNATICSGETYTWAANGQDYTTSQSALTITNDGCTANDVLNLTVTPKPADDVTTVTICSGETYTWAANGQDYTTSQSALTITNDGCTANDVLNLTVTPKPADDVTTVTICSGETYTWAANGQDYTTSQSALTITNDGCTANDVL